MGGEAVVGVGGWNAKKVRCTVQALSQGSRMPSHEQGNKAALDSEVQELLAAGRERDAAHLLLARLSPELKPFLHRLLGDAALADEALSITCEHLWRGLAGFRWECTLRSWSYIVARREASRCRARQARAGIKQTTLSAADDVPARAPTAPGLSTTGLDLLENLRAGLSDEDRDLLVMRVERDLAWKDIAVAFLEDSAAGEAVDREAARLRQRYRSIRVAAASAIARSGARRSTSGKA